MTVIAFQPLQLDGPWRTGELNAMVETLMPEATRPGGLGWDVGLTEIGDPQFYLLGPPQDECLLCISRIGGRYVLEDGAGQVLYEHCRLSLLVERARAALQKRKAQIVARTALVWCALRETVEERLDALVLDGEELLAHCVPQLAALA
jgi:acyl transferase domain-containing protein